ncbi:nuclear transport factor 2 family protein [Frigidibacter sp. RF13]|uniref:YybH family protein n=1 Tax=Frigidibacter sp. RF13 TaxID=2997340 RepID=UPI00226EB3D3|nr:nuclear transport factor 2 family protein [Frigidibacter sp. RF13]MCY1126580.1 nuclear transport factor 2 family protein [Frigidibacter sp. RF13]
MKALKTPIVAALLFVVQGSIAHADDVADASAASDAFYANLSVLDDGSAMSTVFAQTPYITFVGPMSKDIVVGWPALKNYFANANERFNRREARIENRSLHVSGSVAWEVGLEVGEFELKNGSVLPVNWVVTNIYEKQADGTWLIVSHHVQPGAK